MVEEGGAKRAGSGDGKRKSVSPLFSVAPTFISTYHHLAVLNPIGQFVFIAIGPFGEAIRLVAG
jgi:hypothetical protein